MAPSYIIDLMHAKTNTRYLLRSNEGVLLKHPSASNVFLLLSLILKLIFLNWLLISLRY